MPTVHDRTPRDDGDPSSGLQRIAICSAGELFGGVERHILGLLTGLRQQGIAAQLLLFCDGELAEQARRLGFLVQILPKNNRSLPTTSRQLARRLSEERIRIVHVHGYKATVYCALARRWHRFAIAKTEHGLPEPMGGRPVQHFRGRFYHWLDNVATRTAVGTVCYVTKELQAYHRTAHARLRGAVIPNGVAVMDRLATARPSEFDPAGFHAVIVGRLDTVKGQRFAIEAAALQDMPGNLHLHLIGTGPCDAELRALAECRGISQRVHFLGFRRNIYDYIANCDVLLMPSLHEGLPYTLLEAMALAIPIIGSRVGGIAEVMEHEVTALLVPPGNVDSIADAIRRLYRDSALRTRLGEAARRVQETGYSLEVMTTRYLKVYRNLPTARERSWW